MARVHGKDTYVSLGGDDISTYTNNSQITKGADSHDTTTYGADGHEFEGGLENSTITLAGVYDNTALTGPRAVIMPLVGTKVEFIRRPEGTGSGKPEDTADVVVTSYVETNPVADMVTWSADLQVSGVITSSTQAP